MSTFTFNASDVKVILFLGTLSEIIFSHCLVHLGVKMLDFGSPWRPVGSKIVPKVLQLEPKGFKNPSLGVCFYHSKRRPVPSVAIGAFLDIFLVDFGGHFCENFMVLGSIVA